MLDATLLLTVYDLLFVIMTSCTHCHTIIHIHSYNHIPSYTYKHTHTIMQWCCTRGYETFLWKAVPTLVSAPASVQFSGLIVGSLVSAPATTVQFTRVLVESLVSAPATRAVYQIVGHIFCPAHWQLAKLIFEMLVSAPAAGAVQQIDCRIPGLCACHLCSLPEWWLDPWSFPLPPAVYQIVCQIFCLCACDLAVDQVDFQNVSVCACHHWSSGDWLSDPWSLRLPPVQFTGSLIKTFAPAPATLQLARLILKMMVSAIATCGVQGIDCQIPGLCVCHLCSLPDWWLDPWSLRCACHLAVYQVDFQNVGVRACYRWSSAGLLSDPWSACHPCNLREWWLDQVTSLFSAPATRAIDRIDFQTVGFCARPQCSLPS